MDRDNFLIRKKIEAVVVAESIINGLEDPIIGFRKLVSIRSYFPNIRSFDPFVGFDSETDVFPRGPQRENFEEEYLKSLDKEAEEYLSEIRESYMSSCKDLISDLKKSF